MVISIIVNNWFIIKNTTWSYDKLYTIIIKHRLAFGQALNFYNFSLSCLLCPATWGDNWRTAFAERKKERKKTASSVPQPTRIAFVGNLQTAKQYPTHLMTLHSLSIEMFYKLMVENGLFSLRFMLTLSYFVVDVSVCFFQMGVLTVP